MKEQYANDPGEELVASALARMLDSAAPRRNLWPAIQEAARLQPAKSGRRWLRVALVPTAVLGSLVVAFVAFSSLMSSPEDFPVGSATTGPSASEIAAAVSASVPTGVSASEISSMIDSGVSSADTSAGQEAVALELAAAITASVGDQLTAAEVEAIVTAAVAEAASDAVALSGPSSSARATPAPTTLTERPVEAAVPASTPATPGQTTLTEAEVAALVAALRQGGRLQKSR